MPKYYSVSKVLNVRTVNGQKEYLLRWKGYGSGADSWVREEDCNSAVKKFAGSTLEGEYILRIFLVPFVIHCEPNFFPPFISAREKVINYLVCEIGQKLSTRTAPEKGYVRRTTVKVPMDQKFFEELFYSFGQGRSRFNVSAEDLDRILPVGWSERAFRTSTKCVVSREQPITIRIQHAGAKLAPAC